MMKQNELLPKRRFVGFVDEWKKYELGEVSNIIGGGTPSTSVKEFWNGEIDWYSPVEIGDSIYVSNSQRKISELGFKKSSTNLLPAGTILFTSRAGIGKTAILKNEGTTNQGFQSIVPIKNILDTYFLYSRSNELKAYGEKKASGSTFMEISGKQLEKMNIYLPSKKEQQKIGEFFQHFDEMIALQQRKLDKTKALKSAYLAEMFPAEGQRVPKRRFEGFTGEWEEYKLSDLAEISTGKAFSSIDFDDKGKYYVVTNKNIQDQSISIESVGSRINISEKLVLDNYVLRGNNILITMDGNVGRVGKYSDDNAVLAQRVARLNSKQFEFVYQITRKSQFISKMNEVSVGNIIKHISLKQISDYLFMAPKDKKEQEKIGNLLKNIDDIIITDQQKLEKLKSIKKAYLHEMFV